MISRVLVPMDDSPMAERALEFAIGAFPDAKITVFHVVGKPTPYMGESMGLALSDDLNQAARERAQPIFDRALKFASKHGATINTDYALGMPAKAITSKAENFDIVVIGAHGRDVASGLLIGNVTNKVSRRSSVPVTVVR